MERALTRSTNAGVANTDDGRVYKVAQIIGRKAGPKGQVLYLVAWTGYVAHRFIKLLSLFIPQ
jgi:hypothetical protein